MYISKIAYISTNSGAKDEILGMYDPEFFTTYEKYSNDDREVWCDDLTPKGIEQLKELEFISESEASVIIKENIEAILFY